MTTKVAEIRKITKQITIIKKMTARPAATVVNIAAQKSVTNKNPVLERRMDT